MDFSLLLIWFTAAAYGAAFLYYFFYFWDLGPLPARGAPFLIRAGFLLNTFYLGAEAMDQGFFLPVAHLTQALGFFAWSLAFVYLVLLVRIRRELFGLVLTPILLLLSLAAGISKLPIGEIHARPVKMELISPYFVVHITSAFFAYASFTISFAAGILYLIQSRELKTRRAGAFYHKLPALDELERLIYQPLLWGLPLLACALGVGFLWSKAAFGRYWLWDPKTIATIVTAVFYAVVLYLHYVSSLRGKQVALLSIIAFGLVLFSFVGTRLIQGSHPYWQ